MTRRVNTPGRLAAGVLAAACLAAGAAAGDDRIPDGGEAAATTSTARPAASLAGATLTAAAPHPPEAIALLGGEALGLERAGRIEDAVEAAHALVAATRRGLAGGTPEEPADPGEVLRAARRAIASLDEHALCAALRDAAGLPFALVEPGIERALALSPPPPPQGRRHDAPRALRLRLAASEALCHAIIDADAALEARSLALAAELLAEPEEEVRALVLEHLCDCAKPGVALLVVNAFELDPSPRIRAAAHAALVRLAGENLGDDPAAWRARFTPRGAPPGR